MIYTIRTTSGREDIVIDLLMSRIQANNLDIKSVFHPAEIKGYVFVEGSLGGVHKAMQGLMHIRGLIAKPVALQEIQHFLEYKKGARIKVDEGDIVEIIGGPFKGEKGKIIRVNKIKDDVTAELLEASIPIPVTITTEFVKVIKKAHPGRLTEAAPEEKEEEKSVFDTLEEPGKEEAAEEKEAGKAEEAPVEEAKEKEPEAEEPTTPEKAEGPAPEKAEEQKPKKKKSFLDELEEARDE